MVLMAYHKKLNKHHFYEEFKSAASVIHKTKTCGKMKFISVSFWKIFHENPND